MAEFAYADQARGVAAGPVPDKNLEAAIRAVLHDTKTTPLTDADLNNVYVSSFNHGFDPYRYLDIIPPERVLHHHLAGHTNKGTHILDTHSDHVIEPVWKLYGYALRRTGLRATLLEWDADIPAFEVLQAEVEKARTWREKEGSHVAA